MAGVREYRPGDPLRHIDWRATARGTALLVREFEPTTTVRTAVFLDMQHTGYGPNGSGDVLEFTIALAASVVAELAGRGLATGLYASGSVDGHSIASEPASSAAALPNMLEMLARASYYGPASLAELLVTEGARLMRGTSVVVVASDFTEPTLVALSELRRRAAITGLWVISGHGQPPPAGLLDIRRDVAYDDGWKQREIVSLHR